MTVFLGGANNNNRILTYDWPSNTYTLQTTLVKKYPPKFFRFATINFNIFYFDCFFIAEIVSKVNI
jgi:hypothetical protein